MGDLAVGEPERLGLGEQFNVHAALKKIRQRKPEGGPGVEGRVGHSPGAGAGKIRSRLAVKWASLPAHMENLAANAPPNSPGWGERIRRICARQTAGGGFIPQVDGLRSLAVLAVVFFHLDDQLGKPAVAGAVDQALTSLVRRGFLGVPIFFAISAFIVGLPFARHRLLGGPAVATGSFYLRRLTRLEPPYVINMVFLWLLGAALGHWTLAGAGTSLVASLLYQHNLLFGHFSTLNSVAWSLEVEFQFYLLAPLLTLVFAVARPWWRWLLILAATWLVVGLRDPGSRRSELSLLGQFEAFAAGLLVLDIYLTGWRGRLPQTVRWDLAGLMGWIGFFGLSRMADPEIRSLLQTPCLVAGMLGSLGGKWLGRLFGNHWVFTFGGMCYSFYLWHQFLLIEAVPRLPGWVGTDQNYLARFVVTSALLVPPVFVVCTLLFIGLEKPFMRRDWPQRLVHWARTLIRRWPVKAP
jgi:peptidoglycan/LPS O-acetylase OafA/YrhL